jgi:hypothetical protein
MHFCCKTCCHVMSQCKWSVAFDIISKFLESDNNSLTTLSCSLSSGLLITTTPNCLVGDCSTAIASLMVSSSALRDCDGIVVSVNQLLLLVELLIVKSKVFLKKMMFILMLNNLYLLSWTIMKPKW